MSWEIKPCPACGLDVPYKTPRAVCLKCGEWTHRPGGSIGDGSCLQSGGTCHMCERGVPNLDPVRRFLLEDVGLGEEDLDSGVMVMVSVFWTGPDEEKVCSMTGMDPESVKVRADRLRRSGVWDGDGHVYLDGLDQGPLGFYVGIILAAMCADGKVESVKIR